MSATGIGASVKRKEDIRFITGKGHYVDDVNRHGQAYAYFLRSPHAHATIDKIELSDALNAKGVVAIYTGDDIAADKVGSLSSNPKSSRQRSARRACWALRSRALISWKATRVRS